MLEIPPTCFNRESTMQTIAINVRKHFTHHAQLEHHLGGRIISIIDKDSLQLLRRLGICKLF